MVSSPKIPQPGNTPPPPTPAMLAPPKQGAKPNLGGTYLTAAMPGAAPITKPKKTLLGQ